MRLDPGMTAERARAELELRATEAYGSDRLASLRERLDRTAGWMALIAAAPMPIDGDAPDLSGLVRESERQEPA